MKLIKEVAKQIRDYADISLARGLCSDERKTISEKFAQCIIANIREQEIKQTKDFICGLPTKKIEGAKKNEPK